MTLTATISWLDRRLKRRGASRAPVFYPHVDEDLTVYAIGDIHGRIDLLTLMLRLIEDDRRTYPSKSAKIIFLGDYVDRGPRSREVIDRLLSLRTSPSLSIEMLRGNHEQLLLQFLEDPSTAPGWADHGGAATLNSYGVPLPRFRESQALWSEVWEALHRVIPAAHIDFLKGLPLYTSVGDYIFVHGCLRRDIPLDQQTPDDLLWLRPDTQDTPLLSQRTVVHGHNAAAEPSVSKYRIGVDTGAYATGVLTAICLQGYDRRLLQTRPSNRSITP